jgi:hypothetical protein
LRDHRFRALALFADAGVHADAALRVELHGGAVLRGNARAADAVERGGRVGDFDERGKADAAVDAFLTQALLFCAQGRIVHQRVEMRECGVVRQQFELQSRCRLCRIIVVRKQIAPA